MSNSAIDAILQTHRTTHRDLLKAAETLTDDQIRWSPGTTAPSIGFHIWHVARWADHRAVEIGKSTGSRDTASSIWEAEGLAAKWGFIPDRLGRYQTGMGMDDPQSAALPLPPADVLLAYARRALAAEDDACGALTDGGFNVDRVRSPGEQGGPSTLGELVLSSLRHENRHLGMIEALKGAMGMRGTATA